MKDDIVKKIPLSLFGEYRQNIQYDDNLNMNGGAVLLAWPMIANLVNKCMRQQRERPKTGGHPPHICARFVALNIVSSLLWRVDHMFSQCQTYPSLISGPMTIGYVPTVMGNSPICSHDLWRAFKLDVIFDYRQRTDLGSLPNWSIWGFLLWSSIHTTLILTRSPKCSHFVHYVKIVCVKWGHVEFSLFMYEYNVWIHCSNPEF